MKQLIFGSECLACSEPLHKTNYLCPSCCRLLTLIEPTMRCSICFSSEIFHHCERRGLRRQAACFEQSPIARALFQKAESWPAFPRLIAAYFAVQLSRLAWTFDLITIIPLHPLRRLLNFGQTDQAIAKELSAFLKIPFKPLLRALSDEEFRIKRGRRFTGERILIVGLTFPPAMHEAAWALKDAGPCLVYSLVGLERG